MKVSIIVPIYKVQEEIERCLLSVVTQDYRSIELVLVNDCTPDQSFIIAKNYIENSSFSGTVIYVDHDKNKGLSEARNSGLRIATGDYIFFLDSDDQIADEKSITYMVNSLKEANMPDLIIGGSQRLVGNDVIGKNVLDRCDFLDNDAIFSAYVSGRLPTTAWGRLVNRNFLLNEGLFFEPNIYYEDDLWSYLVYKKANKIVTLNEVVYGYHEREGSITTSSLTMKNIDDLYHVISVIYRLYSPEHPQTAIVVERLRRSFIKYLLTFKDQIIIDEYFKKISAINLPLFATYKLRFIEQNLVLRLPSKWSYRYFKHKWK